MVLASLCLLPGLGTATFFFGHTIWYNVASAVGAAVATEALLSQNRDSLRDFSAVLTGLLIAVCLPPMAPIWTPALASFIAIAIGKLAFGGLGKNLFNPALFGYAAVLVAYPVELTHFDAVTGATALDVLAHRGQATVDEVSMNASFGSFGAYGYEWINLAYLISGCFLLATRIITWHIPLGFLLGFALPALIFYDGGSSASWGSPLFHLFAGGTMATALFVATDPVTSPRARTTQFLHALGVGALAISLRVHSSWPDGLSFAVLLGNAIVPLCDHLARKFSK